MDGFAELESDFSVHMLQLWELCEDSTENWDSTPFSSSI